MPPAGKFAFAPPPRSVLAIRHSRLRFPVHRIYCVGQNYRAHALEMGAVPAPFFEKWQAARGRFEAAITRDDPLVPISPESRAIQSISFSGADMSSPCTPAGHPRALIAPGRSTIRTIQ